MGQDQKKYLVGLAPNKQKPPKKWFSPKNKPSKIKDVRWKIACVMYTCHVMKHMSLFEADVSLPLPKEVQEVLAMLEKKR